MNVTNFVFLSSLLDPHYLKTFDVILLSYDALKKDIWLDDAYLSPLTSVVFRRVVLDESQKVKSKSSKVSDMANRLHCHSKWCVTGTPAVDNSVENVRGLLQFLFPFLSLETFSRLLSSSPSNLPSLSLWLPHVIWRSTKASGEVREQCRIPRQVTTVRAVEFRAIERHFYETLVSEEREIGGCCSGKRRGRERGRCG